MMQNRNQLQGEQLADKIITTVKLHLADFEDSQLDQLIALLEGEIRERDEIGNVLSEYNTGEILNDSIGNKEV
jgi:hypothetical protein